MDRIYESGAGQTVPKIPDAPSSGYPIAGNPATGTPATRPGVWWYHMVMEELMAVITAAGIHPDGNTLNQLVTAIQSGKLTAPSLVGSVRNGKISVPAASSTATFTADEIVVETALGGAAYKIASINKTVNLATIGAGGMDTGAAPASGFVALYAIYNPATGAVALMATNATAAAVPEVYGGANMPAGYKASALISVLPVTSGLFNPILQFGRVINIVPSAALISSVIQPNYTGLSISTIVPPSAIKIGGTIAAKNSSTGSQNTFLYLASNNNGIGAVGVEDSLTSASGSEIMCNFNLHLSASQTLFYKSTATTGTPQYTINISSYVF